MRNLVLVLAATFIYAPVSMQAQDVAEAFNIAHTSPQGTARSIGFGGALGSVGGDFSSISVNPAGLGVYRKGELSFTPSFKVNSSTSSYLGSTAADNNVRVNINNFSIVFTDAPKGKRYDRRDWKAISFALGMNRMADFNRDYNYTGVNRTSSATLAFVSNANIDSSNRYYAGTLAYTGWESYLINGYANNYTTAVPYKNGIQQLNSVKERGGVNEYVISLGGNYKEKLLLGMVVGIPGVNYERTSNYSESVLPNAPANPSNFQSFTYNNNISVSGVGINLKLGAIYKLTEFLRLGAAFHSPTAYSITSTNDYGISSAVDGRNINFSTNNDLPQNQFSYSFITPVKGVVSATFIIKKLGFITADYEFVDYSTMKYKFSEGMNTATGYSYQYEAAQVNKDIKNTYQSASNIRLGTEIKLTKFFMLRAGAGYYSNPYINTSWGSDRIDFSGGVGFRGSTFFADFGLVNSRFKASEMPYNRIDYKYVLPAQAPAALPVAKLNYITNNIAFTVGAKF
ncbi:MAG: outer membrane protein transport protein [Taibaiella sp.]|nr:outer membrane protein transport protein [Taibaiella sp.]